jgi:tripartite motif-containing protein 71
VGGVGDLSEQKKTWLIDRPASRLVVAAILAAACCICVLASVATAQPLSARPSATTPYLACPAPAPRHAACQSVIVPPGAKLASPSASTVSPASGGIEGSGLTPSELQSAYKLPSGSAGTGQTVAIIDAWGDPTAESDLATYRSSYGLPACTEANGCFSKVNETGGKSYPPLAKEKEDGDWELETSLDLDMASATCPDCHILLVEAQTSGFGEMSASVNEAVALGATEVSNSWGSGEFSGENEFEAAFHHPGIPITASSGDAGYDNSHSGGSEPNYPASSPGVIAVGGTSLTVAENSRGWSETTWPDSGSGCSLYEPKPWFQTDSGCSMRTTNDVAAVAEGLSVYDTTHAEGTEKLPVWLTVGGTSASTPIIAGVEALSSSAARSSGAAAFYASPSSLFDVTSGSDGSCGGSYLCSAGTGYDGPTGIGTPDGAFPSVSLAPTVTSITPSSGRSTGGTMVTIKGTRFASPATVTIGSEAAEVDVVSAGEIKAKTAATAIGSDEVVVADANGTSSHGSTYTYVTPPPTVTSIEPDSGPAGGGTEVTVTGSGFKAGATVHFGAKSAANVKLSSESELTATAPAGSGTVNVTVSSSTGTSEEGSADRFSYIPPGQTNGINLSGYCETLGYEGVTLAREAVTGPDYAYENWACVKSGGGLVLIAAAGPAPSMDNACSVENPGVAVYAYATEEDDAFTWGCYLVLPTVTSIEPSTGPAAGGTQVKIKGSGFLAGSTVKIGSSATSVEVVSETEIKAKTAATAAGPEEVSVSDVNGTSSLGPTYTYLPPAPVYSTTFTAPTTIEGSLREPDAAAVDASGNVFIADSGHERVLEFNSKREYVRQFGSAGTGSGQFEAIAGIAANSSGDVYVSGSDRVQEFSPTGTFIRKFGSPGSGNGQFAGPSGIAIDSSGNVWVLDSFNYRVQEFSASGEFLSKFGSQGTGSGQLGWAFGLAFSGGNLYVSEFANSHVQEFSTAGSFIAAFGSSGSGNGQFHGPWGIATGPTGNLYVADTANNRVEEFNSSGTFIATFGTAGSGAGQFSGPRGVAVGTGSVVYVADTANNRIEEWAAAKGAGEPPTFAQSFAPANIEGSLKEPDATAVDTSGNVFIADSGHERVLEFNSKREYVRQFGSAGTGAGQFEGIAGIAANSSGDVYVSGSDRVQEFSPTGAFIRKFGSPGSGNGQFAGPSGIAIDSSGNAWVLDSFNYRVEEFSPTGEYLGKFGSQGTGSGQLGWAYGLAFSGGNLYVSEFANNRVQKFSTAGSFIAAFGSSGSGNGQFHGPWAIASDPATGNVYVADAANNRIEEFNSAGTFIATFGAAGSGAGQFSGPRGVAVGPGSVVYVVDTGNQRLEEWVQP